VILGQYPKMSLKQARELRDDLKSKLRKGYDPKVVMNEVDSTMTLQKLFDIWDEKSLQRTDNGAKVKANMENHILPSFGKLDAGQITQPMWVERIDTIAQDTPAMAVQMLSYCRQMLEFGKRRGTLSWNPLKGLQAKNDFGIIRGRGKRVLDDEDIRMLFLAIQHTQIAPKNRIMLQLALAYGCRWQDLRQARKMDFDFEKMIWTVPADRHKTGKSSGAGDILRPIIEGTVPLIRTAMQLAPGSVMFPKQEDPEAVVGATSHISIPYRIIEYLDKHQGLKMAHWTVHDLRRTQRTRQSALRTEYIVAEKMLGHAAGDPYDYHRYMDEMREGYDKWWAKLQTLQP